MPEQYINVTMSDRECFICQRPRKPSAEDDGDIVQIQNKLVYVCPDHFDAFTIGRGLGMQELNTKVVQVLCNLNDSATGWEVKNSVYELIPLAKRQIQEQKRLKKMPIYNPREIYTNLDVHVVGQEEAKTRISLSVFEHFKQIRDNDTQSVAADKHNVLLLGPSGSGKTLIAHTVAKYLELPFSSADSTSFSPTGYQGADVDNTIQDLFLKSKGVINTAETGCVFFDELDKLAPQNHNESSGRSDTLNLSTQNSLLRLIEGKRVKVPLNNLGDSVHVSTNKMLFFFGGAFPGLVDIVAKLEGHANKQIGFRNQDTYAKIDEAKRNYDIVCNADMDILTQSLINYGLNAELIGRIPVIVPLAPLTKEQLNEFLTQLEHSPILRQQYLFSESGYVLDFTDEYIDALIEKTYKMATGARALTLAVKTSVNRAAFDLLVGPTRKKNGHITITADCLKHPENYILNTKTSKNTLKIENVG